VTQYLVDTSAIAAMTRTDVAEALAPLCAQGALATCGVVDLALYATIRDLSDLPHVSAVRRAAFTWLPTDDHDLRRALEVQTLLAADGHRVRHWAPLLVAALAERHQIPVLHNDAVFDLIATATGQVVEWVAPRAG
jgi:predicted nucleic acid-binding protein